MNPLNEETDLYLDCRDFHCVVKFGFRMIGKVNIFQIVITVINNS